MPIPSYVTPVTRARHVNPFDRAAERRPLVVFVDHKLNAGDVDGQGAFAGYPFLPGGSTGFPSSAVVLRSYLTHRAIDALWINDDPDVEGGVTLREPDLRTGSLVFEINRRTGATYSGIEYYDRDVQRAADLAAKYRISEAEALDGLAFQHIAMEAGADVVVTERRWLQEEHERARYSYKPNLISPADALAHIGLYLRWHGDAVIIGGAPLRWGDRSMRWAAARAVLPAWWRWRQAGCARDRQSDDRTLEALTASLLTRVARTLGLRDRIHALSFHDLAGHVDDVLCDFDSLLYSLVGAFDVAARVTDLFCGIGTVNKAHIGWQKTSWRKSLVAHAPEAHAFTEDGSNMAKVFALTRCLRNTVHAEALRTINTSNAIGERRTYVTVPPDEEKELLNLLGVDAEAWGVKSLSAGKIALDVCVFVERILPAALHALDGIMSRVPITSLSGNASLRANARTDDDWAFSETTAHRLRLLFGLAPADGDIPDHTVSAISSYEEN